MYWEGKDLVHRPRDKMRGGNGVIDETVLLNPELAENKISMLSVLTLAPGDSIGLHAHAENAEVYYVLKGELITSDNGTERLLRPGDVTFTHKGATHSLENRSSQPAAIVAVIFPW